MFEVIGGRVQALHGACRCSQEGGDQSRLPRPAGQEWFSKEDEQVVDIVFRENKSDKVSRKPYETFHMTLL